MITLTNKAVTHVKDFLANRGSGVGIRVGVRTAGCSGLAYVLEFVDEPNDTDERFDNDGVGVFVDPKKPCLFGRSANGLRNRRAKFWL